MSFLRSHLETTTALCFLPVAILTPATVHAQSAAVDSAAAAPVEEEIVVTATKRRERLQDVPLAVTANSGEALEAMSANEFVGYARSIPGLSFTDTGTGSQQVAIRGINPSVGESAVTFYIGETPLPASTGNFGGTLANPKLVDIDRVEVLRGPQGTLYGAGSVGGTIRLIPEAPDLSAFGGYVEANARSIRSGGFGTDLSAVLNAPFATERLGLRTAVWYRDQDGFIDRRFPGGEDKDVPHETSWGFRSILAFAPTEALDLSAMVYHQDQEFDGFQDITAGDSNPDEELVQIFPLDIPESVDSRFTLYSLTANYRFDPLQLTSVSSLYRSRRAITEEGSAFIEVLFGGPPFFNRLDETNRTRDFTQEVRLSTTRSLAGFDAIGGFFYKRTKGRRSMVQPTGDWNAQFAPNGPSDPLYAVNNEVFGLSGTSFYREKSFFGELGYTIVDGLKLTGGLRRYDIENGRDETLSGLFAGNVVTVERPRGDFKGTVYKANLSYQATRDHLLYAQYAEGFRPGFGIYAIPDFCNAELEDLGFTSPPRTARPDKVKSFELGAKTSWLDRRLTVNASAYRMDWDDVQQSRFLQCGYTLVTNSRSGARSHGVEIEATARVAGGLSFGLAGSYTKSTFRADEPALGALKGDQLQDVPRWQVAFNSQYDFAIDDRWAGYGRVDLQHTGSSYSDFVRLANSDRRDPLSFKGATTLLNARLGASSGGWEVALYARNLLDDVERQARAISSMLNTPGRPRYIVNEPRSVGIEVRRSF